MNTVPFESSSALARAHTKRWISHPGVLMVESQMVPNVLMQIQRDLNLASARQACFVCRADVVGNEQKDTALGNRTPVTSAQARSFAETREVTARKKRQR